MSASLRSSDHDLMFCKNHQRDRCELNILCLNPNCPQSGLICYLCSFSEPHINTCKQYLTPLRLIQSHDNLFHIHVTELKEKVQKHLEDVNKLKNQMITIIEEYERQTWETFETLNEMSGINFERLLSRFKKKDFLNENELKDFTTHIIRNVKKTVKENEEVWVYCSELNKESNFQTCIDNYIETHQSLVQSTNTSLSLTLTELNEQLKFEDLRPSLSLIRKTMDTIITQQDALPIKSAEQQASNIFSCFDFNTQAPNSENINIRVLNVFSEQQPLASQNDTKSPYFKVQEEKVERSETIENSEKQHTNVSEKIKRSSAPVQIEDDEATKEETLRQQTLQREVIMERSLRTSETPKKSHNTEEIYEGDIKTHPKEETKETEETMYERFKENQREQNIFEQTEMASKIRTPSKEDLELEQEEMPLDYQIKQAEIQMEETDSDEDNESSIDCLRSNRSSASGINDLLRETPARFKQIECSNYIYVLQRPEKRFDAIVISTNKPFISLEGFGFYSPTPINGNQVTMEYKVFDGVHDNAKAILSDTFTLNTETENSSSIGKLLLKSPLKLEQGKFYTLVLRYLDEVRIMYGEGKWLNVGPFVFAGITKKIVKHWLGIKYNLSESEMMYTWQFPYLMYSKKINLDEY